MSAQRSDDRRPPAELLAPAVGAVIFASGEPVQPREIATAFGGIETKDVEAAIETLNGIYERAETGLRIEKIAGGFRLATAPAVGAWVRCFFRQRNRTRLSPAALETLAIIAYKQPVTAPEVQAIRGKDPVAALKSLLDKKMIRILGKKKVVGNPLLYGTSKQFLVHFGLDALSDLPSIEDFEEFVGALEAGQGALFVGNGESDDQSGDPAEAAVEGADVTVSDPGAEPERCSD